ncbi:MAG: hypothetical protein CME70_17630 [Halobacteriovorax sp.]|nr:hypothetical protein [Halobacteriovorax sp.]
MQDILREISSGYFFDLLPIDLTLHFIIGSFITVYCLKCNLGHTKIFLILIAIAGLKELNDYAFHQYAGWQEYATDFGITFFYFGASLLVRRTKSHLTKREAAHDKIKISR